MAPQNLQIRVPTRSGVQYSPEQWAAKQELITQLYAREGKSLREVKEVLRTHHGFRPTDRMYQRKIAQWGLEKKRKAPEMQAALRLARESRSGAETVFRIRGRRVSLEDVYKYFRRRREDPGLLDVHDVPIPPSVTVEKSPPKSQRTQVTNDPSKPSLPQRPVFLEPYTAPIPYPSPDTPYIHPRPLPPPGSSSGSSVPSDSTATTPLFVPEGPPGRPWFFHHPNLPRSIEQTMDDRCARFLLYLTQHFFDLVVPPAFFSQDGANKVILKPWRRILSTWSRATSESRELMQSGQVDGTLSELRSQAHGSVRKHIQNRSPLILLRYFEIIYSLRNSGDERDALYLDSTLKYVLEMAETVLPPWHPIRRLTLLLQTPAAKPIIGFLAQLGIQKSIEILFQRCGPNHPRILYVLDSRTQTLIDDHKYQEASRLASQYLQRAEFIRNGGSFEACQALRMLGDSYVGQGLLDNAVAAYTRAYNNQRPTMPLKDRGVIGVRTQRGLAAVANMQSRYPDAILHLGLASDIAKGVFGEEDVQFKLVRKDLDALHEKVFQIQMQATLAYGSVDA